MKLDAVSTRSSFALLGPGFGGGRWLLTELAEEAGADRVVFAPYESTGREACVFGAAGLEEIDLELESGSPLVPHLDESGHREGVGAIREAIAAGDVYQVNMTLRARLEPVSGATLLSALCRAGVPRFAAWVRFPDGREFVSASPELFFELHGRRVRSEPMKGTAAPGNEAVLASSAKDEAELAMITDLVRNDLTPVCEPRSIRVTSARRFLTLPYAVQAVSDVEGTLRSDVGALDVLDALHPGGSITGAPKHAAMQMIERLETSPRGAYCGALGLVRGDHGIFSLLIRTAERDPTGWRYGVGGGIVWDSDPDAELAEARLKLGALR